MPSNDDRNAEQTRNLFEEQNNKELSALHNQVSSLKQVMRLLFYTVRNALCFAADVLDLLQLTLDINTEIVSQNQFLDGMVRPHHPPVNIAVNL